MADAVFMASVLDVVAVIFREIVSKRVDEIGVVLPVHIHIEALAASSSLGHSVREEMPEQAERIVPDRRLEIRVGIVVVGGVKDCLISGHGLLRHSGRCGLCSAVSLGRAGIRTPAFLGRRAGIRTNPVFVQVGRIAAAVIVVTAKAALIFTL